MSSSWIDVHDKQIADCILNNFQKGDAVPPSAIERKCGMDFRTVVNHLPHVEGKDLGDGTKVRWRQICHDERYLDPLEVKEEDDEFWFWLGLGLGFLGGVLIYVSVITIRAAQTRKYYGYDGFVRVLPCLSSNFQSPKVIQGFTIVNRVPTTKVIQGFTRVN